MTKIIGFVSGKGGVGKTSSSINLGATLSLYGFNVAVVDANLTTPNVGLHLGVSTVPVTLHHVLKSKKTINEATYLHPSGLKIIPGDLSINHLKKLDPSKLEKALLDLEGTLDYVVIDGAAGLGREAVATMKASDELIIVTNPEIPAVTDALKTVQLAHEMKKSISGILLTRCKGEGDMSVREIEDILEYPVMGIIPEDVNMRKSLNLKNPIVLSFNKSEAAKAYKKLGSKISGKRYREEKELNFVEKIIDLLR